MADAACSDTFRVTAISLCGETRPDAIGGSINETVTFLENRPAGRVSPCIAIDAYGCGVTAEYQGHVTPVVRGTQGDTIFTLKTLDGAAATITVADTRAGAFSADFNSKPHKNKQDAMFDAGDTENMAPISVSA